MKLDNMYLYIQGIIPFLVFALFMMVIYTSLQGEVQTLMKIFIILFFIIVGITLIYKGIDVYTKFKKVQNLATSKIRSVAIGLSEIKGKIVYKDILKSPVNKNECAGYIINYVVERITPMPIKPRIVKYSDSDHKMGEFYVEDETGKILIKAQGQTFTPLKKELMKDINTEWHTLYDNYNPTPLHFKYKENQNESKLEKTNRNIEKETLSEFLTLENFSRRYVPVTNIIKIKEECLLEGMEVYILGNVETDEKGNKVIVKGKDNLFEINVNPELKVVDILKYSHIFNFIFGLMFLSISVFFIVTSL